MSKTQLIIFSNRSNDNVRVTLEINGESVNQVDSIKYLGIMMDTKINSQLHLETRKQKFNQASYNLGSACYVRPGRYHTIVKSIGKCQSHICQSCQEMLKSSTKKSCNETPLCYGNHSNTPCYIKIKTQINE